jgi:D-alanyl-D-alanine dipeptidase
MGTAWDYFGDASHTAYPQITPKQRANRQLLLDLMAKHGFENYSKEWWHFTLKNEPFPETYFDFAIR